MGQYSKPDRAYIDFGRPDERKSSSYHVGYRLNIGWFKCGELGICETHIVATSAIRSEDDARWTGVNKPTLPCMQP
jgi:hypothetical protein